MVWVVGWRTCRLACLSRRALGWVLAWMEAYVWTAEGLVYDGQFEMLNGGVVEGWAAWCGILIVPIYVTLLPWETG